jgi:hypothetical protein
MAAGNCPHSVFTYTLGYYQERVLTTRAAPPATGSDGGPHQSRSHTQHDEAPPRPQYCSHSAACASAAQSRFLRCAHQWRVREATTRQGGEGSPLGERRQHASGALGLLVCASEEDGISPGGEEREQLARGGGDRAKRVGPPPNGKSLARKVSSPSPVCVCGSEGAAHMHRGRLSCISCL